MNTLGERIQSLMNNKGLKAPKLADLTGVNLQTLYGYIGDKKKDPSVHNIYAIAKHFNVTIEWLLNGDKPIDEKQIDSLEEDTKELMIRLARGLFQIELSRTNESGT